MIGKIRLLAGAVIVCLAVVPAVVRATRTLDLSGQPSIALSFKSSFDIPPHTADIPPDLSVAPLAVVEFPIAAPVSLPANTAPPRVADPLRGPPVRLRS